MVLLVDAFKFVKDATFFVPQPVSLEAGTVKRFARNDNRGKITLINQAVDTATFHFHPRWFVFG